MLALLAGAVGATAARAQSTPPTPSSPSPAPIGTGDRSRPRPDTLPRPARVDTVRRSRDSVTIAVPAGNDSLRPAGSDSLRGTPDSLKTPKVKRDSIKAALVRAELPTQGIVAGPAYRFRGDTILASGALTLADLLERVPGVTVFRSGYVASAQTAAYLGDFRRIRVFRDGVELDPVDPRNGGVLDLVDVQLWQAEEVSIEPTAGEVRVFIRTRAPRNTTPQTRVDVFTGDQETNLYRAFYGKRFTNGGLLQVNLQQFSTGERSGGRTGGGGDVVNALVRLGWARGNRSIDLTLTRLDRRRNKTLNYLSEDSVLVNFVGRRDEGYLRAGFGDPDQGVWAQAIANVLHFRQESPKTGIALDGDTITSANLRDTTVYRNQYVLTGGLTRWGVRFTATDRYRVGNHDAYHAPQLRAAYERDRLTLSAVAERVGTDSTKRVDVSGRLAILPRLAVLGGASTTTGDSAVGGTRRVARTEVAAQVAKNAWLSVGRIMRDGGIFLPPRVYAVPAGTPVAASEGRVGGIVGSLRGEVLPYITADVAGTAWDRAGLYRPRYQGRAELRFASNFLRRFPTGEFGLNVALSDEYRSAVVFPLAPPPGVGASAADITPTRAAASNLIGGQLEIRIQRAVISYQARNIASRLYQDVPGIYAPRGTISFYGVRWEFSN
ncbi:hypothetical protein tb265_38060 [Gemmatimonadetes bacterium T265]|nr:hypothetical protein tb265_38060 [Gemmatimonadetes bacterium T265]